jgi:putative FmdB family regulatory protein
MPIYEYHCTHCGAEFEVIQKISDALITRCEACGEDTAQRLVSAPGFQLKGTGWYVTDFKDKPKPGAKANEGSDSSKKESAPKKETTQKES